MEMSNFETEAYEGASQVTEKVNNVYGKTKDFISSFLGVLVTLCSTVVVFLVTSATGGNVGIKDIITDWKFWVLVGFACMSGVFVSYINFTSTIQKMKETKAFMKTLKYYSDSKEKAKEYYQYIPLFCVYKNKQTYENAKRNLIESANIVYKDWINGKVKYSDLEGWQKKKIRQIKKIKIKRLTQADLLQEKSEDKTRIRILPISEETKKKEFLASTVGTKFITSFLSGFTMIMGLSLGNWLLGLTFGSSILISAVLSSVQGISYAQSGLRNRYIAKADLLEEFYNIKDKFIEEEATNE